MIVMLNIFSPGVKERLEDTQHELNRTTQQLNTTKQELENAARPVRQTTVPAT